MQEESEHTHQVNLFHWANIFKLSHPELQMMFAIPNGGFRHIRTAIKLKLEGVKPGVPDIFLAYPAKKYTLLPNGDIARDEHEFYNGLFIELKKEHNGRLSAYQSEWIMKLNNAGYKCAVCHGWIAAAEVVCQYLNLDAKACGIK